MNGVLREYIKNVKDLEISLYKQGQLVKFLQQQVAVLRKPQQFAQREKYKLPTGEIAGELLKILGVCLLMAAGQIILGIFDSDMAVFDSIFPYFLIWIVIGVIFFLLGCQ